MVLCRDVSSGLGLCPLCVVSQSILIIAWRSLVLDMSNFLGFYLLRWLLKAVAWLARNGLIAGLICCIRHQGAAWSWSPSHNFSDVRGGTDSAFSASDPCRQFTLFDFNVHTILRTFHRQNIFNNVSHRASQTFSLDLERPSIFKDRLVSWLGRLKPSSYHDTSGFSCCGTPLDGNQITNNWSPWFICEGCKGFIEVEDSK